jgi:hypothetical protein
MSIMLPIVSSETGNGRRQESLILMPAYPIFSARREAGALRRPAAAEIEFIPVSRIIPGENICRK